MINYKKYILPVVLTTFLSTSGYITLTQAAKPFEKPNLYDQVFSAQHAEKSSSSNTIAEKKIEAGSKTHGTNEIDPQHQAMVKEASRAIR